MLHSPTRRGFLGGVTAFATACAIDPEMLLWRPGARKFFIPDGLVSAEEFYGGGCVGNKLLTSREVINNALEILNRNMVFVSRANRDFAGCFMPAVGRTVDIRLPIKFC